MAADRYVLPRTGVFWINRNRNFVLTSCARLGRVAEQMGNLEHALSAYENALRHNPMSLPGLTQVAGIARIKENYPKARILSPPPSAYPRPYYTLFWTPI